LLRNTLTASIIMVSLLAICSLDPGIDGGEPVPSEDAPEPEIEDFDMVLENKTDTYFLEIEIIGTASGNAEQVNLSLVIENETEKMEGFWLEPTNQSFLGMFEVSLEGTGPEEDQWSSWEFYFMLNIPKGEDLLELIELIGGGQDMNLSEFNQTLDPEEIDPDEVARQLSELKVELIARALSGNGTYGEDRMDVTMEIASAVSSFFLGEEDEPGEDRDEENIEDQGENDNDGWFIYVILVVVLLVILITLLIILLISLKRRK